MAELRQLRRNLAQLHFGLLKKFAAVAGCCLLPLLLLLAALLVGPAHADHALSEVWSESEGLQMKYSTNHDDLLSTRGSELSLSTNQRQQQAESAAEPTAESKKSADEQPQEESSGAADENNGHAHPEESVGLTSGADEQEASQQQQQHQQQDSSDSRTSNKYAPVKSAAPAADSEATGKRPAAGLFGNFNSDDEHEHESANRPNEFAYGQPEEETRGGSESDDRQQPQEAAQFEGSDESAAADEQTGQSLGSAGQLGRLAAASHRNKLTAPVAPPPAAANKQNGGRTRELESDGGAQPADEPTPLDEMPTMNNFDSFSSKFLEGRGKNSLRGVSGMADDMSGDQSDGSGGRDQVNPSGGSGGGKQRAAAKRKQQQQQSAAANQIDDKQTDEELSGYGHAHKQTTRAERPLHPLARQQQQQPAANYKQLAYFRGVEHPASGRGGGGGSDQSALDEQSPDSVRDNFISPGHFPGSMPHLTLAASEIEAAQTKPKDETNSSSSLTASSSGATSQDQATSQTAASSRQQPAASDTPTTPTPIPLELAVGVTVEPAVQSDGQQIMAPTLLASTTTMAPEPAANSTAASAATSETTTTTTTPPPSLKRFKFRKYR